MTTKLKWRLGKLPTPEEVTLLLSQGVLTKDEAREILFSLETEEDIEMQSLKDEIIFLRELVQNISKKETIYLPTYVKSVPNDYKPWVAQPWYKPYEVWCSSFDIQGGLTTSGTANLLNLTATSGTTNTVYAYNDGLSQITATQSFPAQVMDFTSVKTF